jgi:hypothetical protein
MAIPLLTISEKNSLERRQRKRTLWPWPGNCRVTNYRTPSLGSTSRSLMNTASQSSRCLCTRGTVERSCGFPWLPDRVSCGNLHGLRAGLCARGCETAVNDCSVGENLPVPVASRTVPADPITKCGFLSHDVGRIECPCFGQILLTCIVNDHAGRRLSGTGNNAGPVVGGANVAYPIRRSPQQALFGASLGPCRGLCPAEGAKEASMCQPNTS